MLTPRMEKLQRKLRRTFADDMLYIYVRPTGIIELRKRTLTVMQNDLVIKRWKSCTPIDRIIYETWERDTWSREKGKYQLIDDERRLRKFKTTSNYVEQERLARMARKQDGKRL